jgi:F0F1-type ATP synthase assembly protein I
MSHHTRQQAGPRQLAGQQQPALGTRRAREADGWAIMCYMISGMVLYGGIGWLVGRWTGISVLFPVGMIVGLALGIALIIYRVTRS